MIQLPEAVKNEVKALISEVIAATILKNLRVRIHALFKAGG
jgi:hypothetical protein